MQKVFIIPNGKSSLYRESVLAMVRKTGLTIYHASNKAGVTTVTGRKATI